MRFAQIVIGSLLTWDAVAGATYYRIYQCPALPCGPTTGRVVAAIDAPRTTWDLRSESQLMYYAITAVTRTMVPVETESGPAAPPVLPACVP